MKTILLWDARFPTRSPQRLSVHDDLASAAVRAGVAAAANPAEAGALSAGSALDPATLIEAVLQHGVNGAMARVVLPLSVVLIGASLGVLGTTGTPVAGTPAPTPPPAPGYPQAAAMVTDWNPATLVGLGNGAAIPIWTDSKSGQQAQQTTPANRPTIRTGGSGGLPYVLLGGDQWLDAGTSGPANTALAEANAAGSTTMLVIRNKQPTQFGFLFSATPSTGYNVFATDAAAGSFGFGKHRIPMTSTGLTTIFIVNRSPGDTTCRLYINGTCYGTVGRLGVSGSDPLIIGSGSAALSALSAKAEVYRARVWNVPLTSLEVMQADRLTRIEHGVALPSAGQPFRVIHGDSLTDGSGADQQLDYPYQLAAAKGWGIGTWTNLGIVGQSIADMRANALTEIDPLVALLSTPMHLAAWNWYNQRGTAGASAWAQMAAYCTARRSAGFARIVLGDSTDANNLSTQERQNRADYNAAIAANWGSVADYYAQISTDPNIGIAGCYSTNYFADDVHLKSNGYGIVAGKFALGFP